MNERSIDETYYFVDSYMKSMFVFGTFLRGCKMTKEEEVLYQSLVQLKRIKLVLSLLFNFSPKNFILSFPLSISLLRYML